MSVLLIKRVRVRQEAFSLVEVMVALGIASVLAVSTSGLMTQLGQNLSTASSKSQFNTIVSRIQSYLNNSSACLSVFQQNMKISYSSLPTSGTKNISMDLTPFGGVPAPVPSPPNIFNLTSLSGSDGQPLKDFTGNLVSGLQNGTSLSINSFQLTSISYLSPNVYQATLQLFAQNYQDSKLKGSVFSQAFTVILSYDSNDSLVACSENAGFVNQNGYSNIPNPTSFGETSGSSGSAGLGTGSADLTLLIQGNGGVQSGFNQPGNFTMYGAQSSASATSGGIFTITSAAAPPSSSKMGSNESPWIQEATADSTPSSTVINASSVTTGAITATSLTINNSGAISTGGAISGGSLTVKGGAVTANSFKTSTTNPGGTIGGYSTGSVNGTTMNLSGGVTAGGSLTLAEGGALSATTMTSTGAIAGQQCNITGLISGGALNIGVVGVPTSNAPVYIGVNKSEAKMSSCNSYTFSGVGSCSDVVDNFSIEATGAVIATSFYTTSDERSKADVIDYENNLSVIEALAVKSYRYRDFHEKGNKEKIGFIAQEVQKVLPQAVQSNSGMVPSIYALATQLSYRAQEKELLMSLEKPHGLKKDDQVKFIDEQNKEKVCSVHRILSSKKFSVQGCWDEKPEQVFVWGKTVDDVLTLNYEAVFSVGIGAIQELKKEKDAEIQALRKTILELKLAKTEKMKSFQETVLRLQQELTSVKKTLNL